MQLTLKTPWIFELAEGCAQFKRTVGNEVILPLPRKTTLFTYFLSCGYTPQEAAEMLISLGITKSDVTTLVFRFLDEYGVLFRRTENKAIQKIESQTVASILRGDFDNNRIRPLPSAVKWIATDRCNRRCNYCYEKEYRSGGGVSEVPVSRMKSFLAEMETAGCSFLSIVGGEPFVYPQMMDLMEDAVGRGICVEIVSKYMFSQDEVQRLSSMDFHYLSLIHSLDTLDPQKGKLFYQEEEYPEKMRKQLISEITQDIAVTVQTVANKINIEEIPELIRHLQTDGMSGIRISRYMRIGKKAIDDLFQLSNEEWDYLKQRYSGAPKVTFLEGEEEKRDSLGRVRCLNGIRSMILLPAGEVVQCDYYRELPNNQYGNINQNSLEEIWNGVRRKEIGERGGICIAK